MLSRSFLVALLVAIVLVFASVEAKEKPRRMEREPIGVSREGLVENHKRRRAQLQKLLEEAKDKVDDHQQGRKLMEGDDFELYKKRIGLYERKLEKMPEEPDESEISRMMERERMRAERQLHREL